MNLPLPGGPYMPNLVFTMLKHGNTAATVNLEVLAGHNDWSVADLRAEFERQEKDWLTKEVNTATSGGEGK